VKISQRVSELSDPEKRHFPLESFIALTTVSALPCRTVTTHFTDPGGMAGWVGHVGWPLYPQSGHTASQSSAGYRESSPARTGGLTTMLRHQLEVVKVNQSCSSRSTTVYIVFIFPYQLHFERYHINFRFYESPFSWSRSTIFKAILVQSTNPISLLTWPSWVGPWTRRVKKNGPVYNSMLQYCKL